jgi:hypothetical protein
VSAVLSRLAICFWKRCASTEWPHLKRTRDTGNWCALLERAKDESPSSELLNWVSQKHLHCSSSSTGPISGRSTLSALYRGARGPPSPSCVEFVLTARPQCARNEHCAVRGLASKEEGPSDLRNPSDAGHCLSLESVPTIACKCFFFERPCTSVSDFDKTLFLLLGGGGLPVCFRLCALQQRRISGFPEHFDAFPDISETP